MWFSCSLSSNVLVSSQVVTTDGYLDQVLVFYFSYFYEGLLFNSIHLVFEPYSMKKYEERAVSLALYVYLSCGVCLTFMLNFAGEEFAKKVF